MMNFGNAMPFGFNLTPIESLEQDDLDEYKRRMFENSPTPMDAFRFSALSMSIDKCLSARDKERYHDAIGIIKGKKSGDKNQAQQTIRDIEQKALSRTESEKDRIEKRREKKEAKLKGRHKRVQVLETGRKGTITSYRLVGSTKDAEITIDFDDEEDNSHEEENYSMNDVIVLCEVCDEKEGKRCGRCKKSYFCGKECQVSVLPYCSIICTDPCTKAHNNICFFTKQKKAWKEHKKVCGTSEQDDWTVFRR